MSLKNSLHTNMSVVRYLFNPPKLDQMIDSQPDSSMYVYWDSGAQEERLVSTMG